ncbi:hypothetical protein QAD02_008050 [Eretmocerus hayati]|uniref:Uncharacterized protein n=1 Tax=Eretmocerus hayati TaxID=131215 RepID=A0ACC2N600_9HYME|nr:hypothetical protein QAD02_008050 [Eretmocerus hayati]
MIKLNRRNDSIGCDQYSPKLPDGETDETQNAKRVPLLTLYGKLGSDDPPSTEEIDDLMAATYSTQRILLNAKERELVKILSDWPFLNHSSYLIKHSSTLIGKDVQKVWDASNEDKFKDMRLFLKVAMKDDEKVEKRHTVVQQSLRVIKAQRNDRPKTSVVIPLLMLYLDEDTCHLYKTIQSDAHEADIISAATSPYPILIIKGDSVYEAKKCYVVVEQAHKIECDDFLQ